MRNINKKLKLLLGEGPFPFQIDKLDFSSMVNIFQGTETAIIESKKGLYLFEGTHFHDSFEFTVPLTIMPPSHAGKATIELERGKIYPFNPCQPHGPVAEMHGCRLLGIHLDKTAVYRMAYYMCGRSDVSFENYGTPVYSSLGSYLQLFKEEAAYKQTGYEFVIQSLSNQIIISLLRHTHSNISSFLSDRNYVEKDNISRAVSFLYENYNKEYSLNEVANAANLSPYHFIRMFKATTGKTPYNYLLDIKIEKAISLLKLKRFSITEICFLCGFNSLEHFSTVFKRKVGTLPSQYRKMIR